MINPVPCRDYTGEGTPVYTANELTCASLPSAKAAISLSWASGASSMAMRGLTAPRWAMRA